MDKIRNFFRNLNLFYKFQVALFVVSTVTLSVMGYFGYYEGKDLLSKRSFELLINITENKRKAIEAYFSDVEKQIKTLSENPNTIQALEDFKTAFRNQNTTSLSQADSALRNFYNREFIEILKHNTLQTEIKDEFTPRLGNETVLQYKYIVQNTYPFGFKENFISSTENDSYDLAHKKYHDAFLSFKKQMTHEDLMLIDAKGNVVYSVSKKTDFARNFITGPFRNSNAGRLFERVIRKREEREVFFEDYEAYTPNFGVPKCFVATPIFDNPFLPKESKKIIGVLMFQINADKITEILTNNQQWKQDGLGSTGETALFGTDFKIRNNTRRFLEDSFDYQQAILKGGEDSTIVERIKRLKTTILLRERKNQIIMEALSGRNGSQTTKDYLGNEVLDVFMPLTFLGNTWAIFTEMDSAEMFSSTTQFQRQLFLIALILFISTTILGVYLANSLSKPMRKIQKEITMLSEGAFPKTSETFYQDELGKIDNALNVLTLNMQDVATFAKNIGSGNFDYEFNPKGQKDILGNALLQMRDNLKKAAIEENDRNWFNKGKALFAETLRKNEETLEQLCEKVVAELVRYISANQGAIFIHQEKENILQAYGTYAYDKIKYNQKNILPGEGLVGQTFLEKEKIYLTEIPESYSKILSGLGQARPRCIIVLPINYNQKIYGVIELASLEQLKPIELEFLDSISQDIATTIASIKVNEETRKLLQESQKAGRQLRQQEEEMRQNFEELMATQEEMKRRQEQLDLLLHGKINLDELQSETYQNGLVWEDDNLNIEKRVKNAILRQKVMLDKAAEKNKTREEIIKTKVSQINGSKKEN